MDFPTPTLAFALTSTRTRTGRSAVRHFILPWSQALLVRDYFIITCTLTLGHATLRLRQDAAKGRWAKPSSASAVAFSFAIFDPGQETADGHLYDLPIATSPSACPVDIPQAVQVREKSRPFAGPRSDPPEALHMRTSPFTPVIPVNILQEPCSSLGHLNEPEHEPESGKNTHPPARMGKDLTINYA
jgi:hypothetical protein